MVSRYFGSPGVSTADGAIDASPVNAMPAPEHRMALLVGNERYAQGKLANPANDVRLIGEVLRSIGFETTVIVNAAKSNLQTAVLNFCAALEAKGPDTVAIFYFAGHGIQQDGTNYLLPVDADIPTQRHLGIGALAVDEVVKELAHAPRKANVIVLDACRNNPLPRMAAQSRDVTRGLAALQLSIDGMLVAYSTATGAVADDGDGDRGPYAAALIQSLPGLLIPGRRIHDVFVEVADRVRSVTGGKQNPALFLQGSLPALVTSDADRVRFQDAVFYQRRKPVERRVSALAVAGGLIAALGLGWVALAPPSVTRGFTAGQFAGKSASALLEGLAVDPDASVVPAGYAFDLVQGIATGEEDAQQNVSGRIELRFDRTAAFAGQPLPDGAWEGFQYYVFGDAAAAAKFTMTGPEAVDNLKNLLGFERARKAFIPKARTPLSMNVRSSTGAFLPLRCVVADTLIGCLAAIENAPVAVHLMLQQPQLSQAKSDNERQALAMARVQNEVTGLLQAAEAHLARAVRVAK